MQPLGCTRYGLIYEARRKRLSPPIVTVWHNKKSPQSCTVFYLHLLNGVAAVIPRKVHHFSLLNSFHGMNKEVFSNKIIGDLYLQESVSVIAILACEAVSIKHGRTMKIGLHWGHFFCTPKLRHVCMKFCCAVAIAGVNNELH